MENSVPNTVTEILEENDYDPLNGSTSLTALLTIGYDGAGSYAQIQGGSIGIDTTKNIIGKLYICFPYLSSIFN